MSHVSSSSFTSGSAAGPAAGGQPSMPGSPGGSTEVRLLRQFESLCQLTTHLNTGCPDPAHCLRSLLEIAASTLKAERVSIWMINSSRTAFDCLNCYNVSDGSYICPAALTASAFPSTADGLDSPISAYLIDSRNRFRPISPTIQDGAEDWIGPRLDVPIRVRGDTVGFVSYEYSITQRRWEVDELSFALVIASIVSRAAEYIEARRGEEELVYRLKFEELLTSLAMLFINLSADSVNEGINHALEEIGRFSAVDRSYIIYSSDDLHSISNINQWCASGIAYPSSSLASCTPLNFPWLFNQLTENDSLKIDRLSELPAAAQQERTEFESRGVKSLVIVPLLSSGRRAGCLALETVISERTWEEGDISFLRIVGEMFVNALDRKSTEEQLKGQQSFFRMVIDLNPNFIFAKDREGRFTLVNQAVADAYGSTVEALVGKSDGDFNSNQEEVEWFRRADKEVMNSRIQKFIPEEQITDALGRVRWLQTVKIPIVGSDGQATHLLGVATDITERKRQEEEQWRLESHIQHTQKLESLGVLAGGIAHDFNNLLMGVLGNVGLALMELPEGPARNRMEQIKIAAKRASELTNQLLAYSGKGKFIVGPIDLNTVVGEMTALLETIISKKASFKLNLSSDVKAVEADATQLRQIVMNLITNASDSLGELPGTISISTGTKFLSRAESQDYLLKDNISNGDYSYLEISDTGCGMTLETLQKIFDPFYTTKFTGRGLGLAAVIGIVRSHRGTLSVKSAPGNGTTFRVYFPVLSSPAKTITAEAKPPDEELKREGLFLVVDDEETSRTVAAEMLRHFGFDVITACDGREGVDKFKDFSDKLSGVLLDMTMPILDGEEALGEMVKINQNVPIIMSSGYCEQDVTDRFKNMCLAGFIQKPYGPAALLQIINQVRSRNR